MKIDRHNYEEFFILYWDNELSAEQKQAVKDFIAQNADLREEFELFGESRFTPDPAIQLKEKDFLLNDSFINITNYEEQLLNYIDNELTTEEKNKVEKFVQVQPAAQQELALLQKTKLQPEAEIIFPDKSVLYRREEKPVRIISMTWFRVAVAAAIIVIAGFTALQFINNGKNGNNNGFATIDNSKNTTVQDEEKNSKTPSTNSEKTIPGESITKVKDRKTIEKKEGYPLDEKNTEQILTKNEPENKNNLPKPRTDRTTNDRDASIDASVNETFAYTPVELEKVGKVQKTETPLINASFVDSDVTNKPQIALDIPEAEAKGKDGGGLKEFLRKTTRVFERRTKIQTTTEDNKLLVGAFAVSLK